MHGIAVWIQTVLIPTLGPVGLFLVAFFDSSFLSVPEINDVLVVSAGASNPRSVWMFVLAATFGSLAGCTALWYLGRRGGEALLVKRFGAARVEQTRAIFRRWDLLALAVPAMAPPPMPFKIFVLSAGVFGLPFRRFAITLIVARGLRYTFWGVIGVIYGHRAVAMLQRVDAWFRANAVALLAGLAVLAAVGLVTAWAWGRRAAKAPAGPLL